MKATLWKTHYFSLFEQHNDYKWAKIVIYLIYLFRIFQGQIAILWKFSQRSLENFTRSQKNKTVTFNDCILGIYGSNINDFQAIPHAFPSRWFNPTFACPRAVNVPSDFEFISYRNNLRRKLSIYFCKTRPLLNIVIAKEDWLLFFRSNTIIWLCIKVERGQGDGDIGTRVWGLGTWGRETRDLRTSSMGRRDVKYRDAGDAECE